MKPRPPTLRENRRYVLVRVEPPWPVAENRVIYSAVAEAVTSLFGDAGVARVQPAVIAGGPGWAIVRCIRSTEEDLLAALATVTCVDSQRRALRPLRTSGTVQALRRLLCAVETTPVTGGEEVIYGGRTFSPVRYPGEKVDLFEKGFKSQEPLFLTAEDLEE
ncbi:MAG: ribonuclease P [Methanolinea sp.]|nr:ribonuclease P [Methanolinea sp.]